MGGDKRYGWLAQLQAGDEVALRVHFGFSGTRHGLGRVQRVTPSGQMRVEVTTHPADTRLDEVVRFSARGDAIDAFQGPRMLRIIEPGEESPRGLDHIGREELVRAMRGESIERDVANRVDAVESRLRRWRQGHRDLDDLEAMGEALAPLEALLGLTSTKT